MHLPEQIISTHIWDLFFAALYKFWGFDISPPHFSEACI